MESSALTGTQQGRLELLSFKKTFCKECVNTWVHLSSVDDFHFSCLKGNHHPLTQLCPSQRVPYLECLSSLKSSTILCVYNGRVGDVEAIFKYP